MKEPQKFAVKYCLTVELLYLRYRLRKISVFSTTLVSAITGPGVTFADM